MGEGVSTVTSLQGSLLHVLADECINIAMIEELSLFFIKQKMVNMLNISLTLSH